MSRRDGSAIRGLAALVALLATTLAHAAPPAPTFVVAEDAIDADGRLVATSREGHVSLEWTLGDAAGDTHWIYELESARRADFTDAVRRHEGHDFISFVSGLENGDHCFRVRARAPEDGAAWGPWSRTVIVPVEHQSLGTALSLAAAGEAIFLATVGVIAVNARRTTEPEAAHG